MGFSQDLQFFRAALREEGVVTPQRTRGKIWRIKGKHDNFQPKRAATKVWRFWSRAPHVSQPPFWNTQSQAWKMAFRCVLARNPAAETLLSKCRASLFIQISPQCLFKGKC